ncbi:hypothetical protein ACFLZQ_05865 [Thermodesulfobacteriota bacterium]
MKSIIFVLAMVLIFLPAFTYAEQVYLDCTVLDFDNDSSIRFTVKADESSGKITHTEREGKAYNIEGFFAPNKTSYQTKEYVRAFNAYFIYRFDINRSTLEVRRYSDTTDRGPGTDTFLPAGEGECENLNVKDPRF